jgi:hypothetical protein
VKISQSERFYPIRRVSSVPSLAPTATRARRGSRGRNRRPGRGTVSAPPGKLPRLVQPFPYPIPVFDRHGLGFDGNARLQSLGDALSRAGRFSHRNPI